jgi:chemotaxis protein MotA
MNVILGLAGLVAVFMLTLAGGHPHEFTGLFYKPAFILLAAAPPCIALLSYKLEDFVDCARRLYAAGRHSAHKSRTELYDDFNAFAQELRQRRPMEALAIAERSRHPLFGRIAPLAVKQASPEALEKFAATAVYAMASEMKRAEEMLVTLARVSPAVGLIGTVSGLISLLKDLSHFDQLGPSMALALLCTFYGLVAANAVYQPLARVLHFQSTAVIEESRTLARALAMLAEGASLADARSLFEPRRQESATAASASPAV